MNVSYDEQIRRSPEFLSLAEQAMPQLEAVVGPAHAGAQAEWGYEEEGGHKWATLRVRDRADEATTQLEVKELQDPNRLRARLLRVWGDLLQVRSDWLRDDLMGNGGSPVGV